MRTGRTAALALVALVALVPGRAGAATIVDLSASPDPASVGTKVVHVVRVGAYAPLDVWVSASGFEQPRLGTLPPGQWRLECCSAVEGGQAWHFRSGGGVPPGSYRFGAVARATGLFGSRAAVQASSDVVWIRIT
jgi:hypothetical protein